MNFIEEFKKGQQGENRGLYMGDGVAHLSRAINGLQRARILGIASAPKVGKSTFADYACTINPVFDAQQKGIPIHVIYFSFELDRVSKEFDFATYFLHKDYGIDIITLPNGSTKNGKDTIDLSADYLRGRITDDDNKIIRIDSHVEKCLHDVYEKRIVPLFGEYGKRGERMRNGTIDVVEHRDTPTGLYRYLKQYATQHGQFFYAGSKDDLRIAGYRPNDPALFTIIIVDHLRKIIPEKGFSIKQTMDRFVEQSVELRNICGFTFVHIVHTNRNLTNVQRLMQFEDQLVPTSDDIKDSGNIAEEADYMLTMFNPNDTKYNLLKFFGFNIRYENGDPIYPNLRTIHLVESRHCVYPQHFAVNMYGNFKDFSICSLSSNN